MSSRQIGEVTITKILESEALLDRGHLVPQGADIEPSDHEWAVGPFIDPETGQDKVSFHSYGLQLGDEKVLVDTCGGNHKPRPGSALFHMQETDFLDRLTASGFPPEEVTAVICTHLHVDHVGWNTYLDGDQWKPTFPNARHLFGEREWAHWSVEPQVYGDVAGDSVRPVIDAGKAELISSDFQLNDLVWLEPTPGHTPGHHSVRISSNGDDAVITGDLVHSSLQFEHPEWASAPDVDAAAAATTRRRFIEKYCDDHTLILATHLGGPSCGHIRPHSDRKGSWWLDAAG